MEESFGLLYPEECSSHADPAAWGWGYSLQNVRLKGKGAVLEVIQDVAMV